jgi:hypothetical protein
MSYNKNLQQSPTIFFVCTNPERALGLEKVLSNYHIVCIDNSPIVDQISSNIFCTSKEEIQLEKRSSFKLLENPQAQQYILENTPEGEVPNIIVFKIASNIEKTIEKLGWNLLNTTSKLNQAFEHKISQFNLLANANIKFPKTVISKIGETTYSSLQFQLGSEFVLQFNRGHSGEGTIFIDSEAQYNELVDMFPNREVRIAEKIKGSAWTLNACVTKYGIAMGGLSYQVTGIPLLTQHKGGTVGNDWASSKQLSDDVITSFKEQTEKIGLIMADHGYKGLFGIDLILTPDNEIVIIEVNARQTASVSMHNKLMLKDNLIPLSKLHLAEFLYNNGDESSQEDQYQAFIGKDINAEIIRTQNSKALETNKASQLILRKQENTNLSETSGIYENGEFIRDGYSIDDLLNINEYLLLNQDFGTDAAIIQANQPHEFILEKFKNLLSKEIIE